MKGAAAAFVMALAAVTAAQSPSPAPASRPTPAALAAGLDEIFAAPALTRALIAVRVDSLTTGETLYRRNDDKLVMPASNMKIVTMTTAAERLGWTYTYRTTLDAVGTIANGVLTGDLVVVGGGDPTIVSNDAGPAAVFGDWAAALRAAGITRVNGRIIGDDSVFDDDAFGMGWSWDDLVYGYSTGITGLSYNENQITLRVSPGAAPGAPAAIDARPAGSHGLTIVNKVTTVARPADATAGDPRLRASVDFARSAGHPALVLTGAIPVGANPVTQDVAVDNPTRFFVTALRDALLADGILVRDGVADLDDLPTAPSGPRRTVVTRTSPPLSVIGPYFMKVSQNFVAETLFKTLGRVVKGEGSAAAGRAVVLETLENWGVPPDALVMRDGSGLSRYNYLTTGGIVSMLTHMWRNDALRGPFAAALPVAGHDGTLGSRMKNTWLDTHVQAKTGTISNVRSLSGYLETKSGERLVFSMIGNHFTVPSAQIDAIVEKALAYLADQR